MALFRRPKTQILRRSSDDGNVEHVKTMKVGRDTVEVRRVENRSEDRQQKRSRQDKKPKRDDRPGLTTTRSRDRRIRDEELILPVESTKKQMLIRVSSTQTQIVVMEGPVLVEHYVARESAVSLAGNIYLAKTRNVLPGMEAAFLDFGASKNGVLYASDVYVDGAKFGRRQPRIEEALAEGDETLVQVTKDAMGAKGARLTGMPSIPGRYLVLVPDSDNVGISRRLPEEDRIRLREAIDKVRPAGFGVIVRTAAQHASAEEIAADISRLVKSWEEIKATADAGSAPRLVHSEPELLIRVIREHFTADFKRLLIDDRVAHEKVLAYLRSTAPDLVSKVQLYEDSLPLFERYHVEDQLKKALERRVYLPSGGHLVVDRTEALTVIDVNTGKFVGSSNLEETVLHNNLEAAEEIARQLRLRDIGGIIVIDFIDMESTANQQQVIHALKVALAKDKTRTQVFDVSHLGLVEMTRKNVSAGLLEHFSEKCSHCEGRGVIVHEDLGFQQLTVDSEV